MGKTSEGFCGWNFGITGHDSILVVEFDMHMRSSVTIFSSTPNAWGANRLVVDKILVEACSQLSPCGLFLVNVATKIVRHCNPNPDATAMLESHAPR